ncbi:MAG: amino acid permease, partial [Gammaproteobacteria bacterium]
MRDKTHRIHRPRGRALGVTELVAIALGGMIGGGIFSILGVSVSMVGSYAVLAIAIGGGLALLAGYSYAKLGVHFQDEGGSYAFARKAFPNHPIVAGLIGWWVTFGYVSTLALYAYTFASYLVGGLGYEGGESVRIFAALAILVFFVAVNLWSVRGMGKLEDLMVYIKLFVLAGISVLLVFYGKDNAAPAVAEADHFPGLVNLLMATSLTFVAYEGFQLVINAVQEIDKPSSQIPLAIYLAILVATGIYVLIAYAAINAIDVKVLVEHQEYALAAGARDIVGKWGEALVIAGALLATASAISGTMFGASRQMAEIAKDGFMPRFFAKRVRGTIPQRAVLLMGGLAAVMVIGGTLRLILEFGSVTFLLVSLAVAVMNYRLSGETQASAILSTLAIGGLGLATILILWFEWQHKPEQLLFILMIYLL